MVASYWGGCFPMSLLLDSVTDLGAASYWFGLDFGVGCSALLMVLRLFYVERVMDGRPVPVIDNILAFFKLKTAASGMPAYAAAFSGEDHSIRAVVEMNIKQAEKLIAFMTEMEEKLSVLIQNVKEAEVDIFTETRRVLPIRKALLTDLHLSILGHATRAYVP